MLTLDTCFSLIRLLLANIYGCIGFRMRLHRLSHAAAFAFTCGCVARQVHSVVCLVAFCPLSSSFHTCKKSFFRQKFHAFTAVINILSASAYW